MTNQSAAAVAVSNSKPSGPASRGGQVIPIVCPGHTRPLAELQFLHLPDENKTLLVSACHDKLPMLRDGLSGDWIGTLQGHKGAVWSATLDKTGSLAATGSGDFCAKLWDGVTGKELVTLQHGHIVKTCAFSPDSLYLATGGQEGKVRVYSLETALQTYQPPKSATAAELEPCWTIAVPGTTILKVCWLDSNTVLAGCGDGKIRVWSIPSGADANDVANPEQPVAIMDTATGKEIRDMDLAITGNGATILTVASSNQVLFFNVDTKSSSCFSLLKQHKVPIHFLNEGGACLHPNGRVFIAGGSDLWVRLCDYETGEVLDTFKGHHGPIRCLRYNPNGSAFASGSEDGTIRLWETTKADGAETAAGVCK
ncbi:hypothetical protein MPSEU_000772900 [Mayamaea pseudoterrestris]|nr:hypothetical protein MPSEU_000772900 [Mayamaea pseudoterrestris]